MLVLNVESKYSDSQNPTLVCTVFEGTAHIGDTLEYAAIYTIISYGFNKKEQDLSLSYKLERFYPTHFTITSTRRFNIFTAIPTGFSGLFDFETPEQSDWSLFQEINAARQNPKMHLESPSLHTRLCLFDSEASAHAYTQRMLHLAATNLKRL